jgi:hypothetical protein
MGKAQKQNGVVYLQLDHTFDGRHFLQINLHDDAEQ